MIRETFAAHNYIKQEVTKSKIDPNVIQTKDIAIIYPRCKAELPLLWHGAEQTCNCGLHMQLFGNGLTCTIKE